MRATVAALFPLTMILVAILPRALSQTTAGSMHGVITDTTGGVIPAVEVEVRSDETGAVRQIVTNNVGLYTARELPPGHYTVQAKKSGFASVVASNLQLLVNQDLDVSLTMTIGENAQQIDVQSSAAAVSTTDSTIGSVIEEKQIVDLPLNGRQFTQLILLTPGAVPKEAGQQAAFIVPLGSAGISPSVNGQRPQQNNFTLDGVSNNAVFTNTWTVSPPPDAIQEFKIQSHVTEAEFGNSPGANVNVAIKSGTNALHGDLWEFLRNDKLDAANYFTNAVGQSKPPYRQNQYGLTFGGPVMLPTPKGVYDGRKHGTYFFGYWEAFNGRQNLTSLLNVPPPGQLTGDFSSLLTSQPVATDALGRTINSGQLFNPFTTRQVNTGVVDPTTGLVGQGAGMVRDPFPRNIIPTSMLNAAALAYLKAWYPAPNLPGSGANYATAVATQTDSQQYGAKLDQNFSNGDRFSGAIYMANAARNVPQGLLLGSQILNNPGELISLGYTHLFSSSFIATLRYGYDYSNFNEYYTPGGLTLLNAVNAQGILPLKYGLPSVPAVSVTGLTGTNQVVYGFGPDHQHTLSGNVAKLAGSHQINAGFTLSRIHALDDGRAISTAFDQYPTSAIYGNGVNATNTGNGLASMLLGLPSTLSGQVGSTNGDASGWLQGYYVEDTWRINSRLTIHYGLRYDYAQPFTWHKPVSGFVQSCQCFQVSQAFPPSFPNATAPDTWFRPERNGFQPRFGFAYKITAKTVVRSGFAIFDDYDNNLIQGQLIERLSWPWGVGLNIASQNRGVPNLFFNNLPSAASLLPQVGQPATNPSQTWQGDPDNKKIPYSMLWNFGVEHTLSNNLLLKVGYVGSGSRHLYMSTLFNTPLPNQMGPGPIAPRSPYPQLNQFSMESNVANSNYNSLQLSLEGRLPGGLILTGAYTWSHCFSVPSDSAEDGGNQNPYNFRPDYSSCDQDVRHVFLLNYIYELPFGKGKSLGGSWNAVTNAVLGGWTVGGITSVETGLPFNVTVPFDNANVGRAGERAQLVGNASPDGFQQNIAQWYNGSAFVVPAAYTYGNLGRNILRAPGLVNFDLNTSKVFRVTESARLRFSADFFNIANHAEFNAPNGSITTPTFMKITSARSSRDIQFGLKMSF